MKITLPENISEITLRQFLKYEDLLWRDLDVYNFNKRKIHIFTGIPISQIDNIKGVDAERILNQIDLALNTDAQFVDRFTMHDIEFGFIPNLDKMTLGEFSTLSTLGTEKENLHYIMAILFRPVVKSNKEKYDIVSWNGSDEYAEMMKDMPLNIVNGALVFFLNLANELQEATQRCLTEELQKDMQQKTTSRILGGTRQLRSWLKTISLKLTK